jgi:hypothetical protein
MTDTHEVRPYVADATAQSRRLSVAAWAGIIGPALFTAGFLGLEAVLGSRYNRVSSGRRRAIWLVHRSTSSYSESSPSPSP